MIGAAGFSIGNSLLTFHILGHQRPQQVTFQEVPFGQDGLPSYLNQPSIGHRYALLQGHCRQDSLVAVGRNAQSPQSYQ